MSKIDINIKILSHGKDLSLPSYATHSSAGMDLYAALENDITLAPNERTLVPTGFSMALPNEADGLLFEAQVRPRSGLALKYGITVLNTPGTIDADYRGEIKVILINLGNEPFVITRGMRIAQMIIAPVTQAAFTIVSNLDDTDRGEGGFGSTGTHG